MKQKILNKIEFDNYKVRFRITNNELSADI